MKKIMYLAAALLVLVGCNKNSQEAKENAPANYGTITGTIELPQTPNKIVAPNGWKAMTEAFKMQWESSDKIYIFNGSECKELTVKDINAQSGNATFEGDLLSDMTIYNVAYGYNPTAGATAFAVDYIADNYRPFAWGTGENYIFTIDDFGPVMGFKLKGTAKVGKIEVIASKSSAAQATYTMTFGTAIELNATTPTVVYFPLNDLGDADKLEAKFYQGESVLKAQAFVTLPAKNVVTTYPAIEVNDPYNGHEFVDLGLSVNWATMNVGATTPDSNGDYFAWGETSPYYTGLNSDGTAQGWKAGKEEGYAWQSYEGFTSEEDFITEWTPAPYDENYNLKPEYDAAHVNWGGVWRMPTLLECIELEENCDLEWTTQNNVQGCKITSNVPGYEGNSIFLPVVHYYYEKQLDTDYLGYWLSTFDLSFVEDYDMYIKAHMLYTAYDDYIDPGMASRYLGFPVRAVCPKN